MATKKHQRVKLVEYIGDDSISPDSALIAAGIVLMEAAELCKDQKDTEGLIRVANAWYDISKTLMDIEDEESKKQPFGFGLAQVGEDEDGDDESTGIIEVRKKPRQLRKRTR